MDEASVLQSSISGNVQPVWSDIPQTLGDILESNTLPVVVKICTDNHLVPSQRTGSDIHQPLVIYKELRGTKIYAKNVTSIDLLATAPVKDNGTTVVIPDTYKGWFRLIDDQEKPLTTVANVARLMPIQILSSKFVTGFVIKDEKPSNSTDTLYQKVEVQPGVLIVKNIFEDFVRYTTYRKVIKRKLLRCLCCVMDDGTEVLLPFDAEGAFFLVETRKTTSKHINTDAIGFVYSINDLLKAGLSKGVYIKLFHGRPPAKPCGFTNILQVCEIIKDHTVVACTMNEHKHLLELPVAKIPHFVKATNTTDLYMNGIYAEAVSHLEKTAQEYSSEIKVRFHYSVETTEKKKKSTTKKEKSES